MPFSSFSYKLYVVGLYLLPMAHNGLYDTFCRAIYQLLNLGQIYDISHFSNEDFEGNFFSKRIGRLTFKYS